MHVFYSLEYCIIIVHCAFLSVCMINTCTIIATTVGLWKHIPTRRGDPDCATCHQSSWVCLPLHQARCISWMCRGGWISCHSRMGYHCRYILLLFHVVHAAFHEHIISGCKDASAPAASANDAFFWSLCSMHRNMCQELCPGPACEKVETACWTNKSIWYSTNYYDSVCNFWFICIMYTCILWWIESSHVAFVIIHYQYVCDTKPRSAIKHADDITIHAPCMQQSVV